MLNNNFINFHRNNDDKKNQMPNISVAANNSQENVGVSNLRSVQEVSLKYRHIFSNFPYFNKIQSRVLDCVLSTDESVVVAAPTGSGKTVIFELAIVRFLTTLENYQLHLPFKIVYVAPMKALCEERLTDWHCKFSALGLNCLCVTGDSDNSDFQSLLNYNLIITTPEKWDALTRRWKDNRKLASLVKLFMIDEVHLLGEFDRGPTLEAVVCRMKTIQESCGASDDILNSMKIRFLAASATVPNVEDIARWLNTFAVPAKYFKFDEDMRPVKLKKVVLGYPYNWQQSTPFKFDMMLSYKLQSVIMQYSEGKPTLIFCNTRKSVEMTAKVLIQNITINQKLEGKQAVNAAVVDVSDERIKQSLVHGIGYHHAGLSPEDRKITEELFRNGNLPVLVTTTTLAMGINLPAHLVVIKSTKYYCNGEYKDYSESMLFQMIGRAGRPQFDSSATAVVLTTNADKQRFENMVGGQQIVESSLHKHFAEHLNAEVVLNTITDLGMAMEWLRSTFLYIRAKNNPRYYGLSLELTPEQIDNKLLDMCQIELNRLARFGMLTIDQNDVTITPTKAGLLMAKYCIALDTMSLFIEVTGTEVLQQILGLISKCKEFSDVHLRVNEKKALNLLNQCKHSETIRFPFNGKIQSVDMKINCISQAVFGCLNIGEQSLMTESQKIMRIGERTSKCLAEFLETKDHSYSALLNALILTKCFHTRLWEISPYVCKQLTGIGSALSSSLVSAGKTTFKELLSTNPRDIERIIKRRAPMGNTIQDQITHLPDFDLTLEELLNGSRFTIVLKIILKNAVLLKINSSVNVKSNMCLLVGDSDNEIFVYEKYRHSFLIENPEIIKKFDFPSNYQHKIYAHFISEDWVGFDSNASFLPLSAKRIENNREINRMDNAVGTTNQPKTNNRKRSHIQTFVDTFFKNNKNITQNRKQENYQPITKTKFNLVEHKGKTSVSGASKNTTSKDPIANYHILKDVVESATISPCEEVRANGNQTGNTLEQIVSESVDQYETQKERTKNNLGYKLPPLPSSSIVSVRPKLGVLKSVPKVPTKKTYRLSKMMNYDVSLHNTAGVSTQMMPKELQQISNFNYIPKPILTDKNIAEEMSGNSANSKINEHKSITWRSPLITSPKVKYSPIKLSTFSFDLKKSCTDSKVRPTLRNNEWSGVEILPLTDKEYAQFQSNQATQEKTIHSDDSVLSPSLFEGLDKNQSFKHSSASGSKATTKISFKESKPQVVDSVSQYFSQLNSTINTQMSICKSPSKLVPFQIIEENEIVEEDELSDNENKENLSPLNKSPKTEPEQCVPARLFNFSGGTSDPDVFGALENQSFNSANSSHTNMDNSFINDVRRPRELSPSNFDLSAQWNFMPMDEPRSFLPNHPNIPQTHFDDSLYDTTHPPRSYYTYPRASTSYMNPLSEPNSYTFMRDRDFYYSQPLYWDRRETTSRYAYHQRMFEEVPYHFQDEYAGLQPRIRNMYCDYPQTYIPPEYSYRSRSNPYFRPEYRPNGKHVMMGRYLNSLDSQPYQSFIAPPQVLSPPIANPFNNVGFGDTSDEDY